MIKFRSKRFVLNRIFQFIFALFVFCFFLLKIIHLSKNPSYQRPWFLPPNFAIYKLNIKTYRSWIISRNQQSLIWEQPLPLHNLILPLDWTIFRIPQFQNRCLVSRKFQHPFSSRETQDLPSHSSPWIISLFLNVLYSTYSVCFF